MIAQISAVKIDTESGIFNNFLNTSAIGCQTNGIYMKE